LDGIFFFSAVTDDKSLRMYREFEEEETKEVVNQCGGSSKSLGAYEFNFIFIKK